MEEAFAAEAEDQLSPGQIWYLAEGYTGGEFDTWVLVQNPGEEDAHATLSFQLPPGASAEPIELDVPAGTRRSVRLDDLPGLSDTDVSTTVVSDKPVVAERAMYFEYQGKAGGSCSQGYSGYVDPVFSPQAKVLTGSAGALLESASGDLSKLVFKGADPFLEGLCTGDIIAAPPMDGIPFGMLRKIKRIAREGDTITVFTEQAQLADAIKQCDFSMYEFLTADDIYDQAYYGEGVTIGEGFDATAAGEEIGIRLDDVTLLEEEGAKITLDGEISVKTGIDFHVRIDWGGLKELSFTASAQQHAELSIFAGLSKDFDKKVPVLPEPILFSPITIWIGWWPVVIVPTMQVYAGAEGEVYVGLTASVEESASVTAGVAYSNGDWGKISDFSVDFGYEEPQPTAGGTIKPYAGPRFMLLLYGLAGPYAEINAYLEFDIDVFRDPWWILYGGLEANVGVQFSVLDRVIADKDFPLVVFMRREIAKAPVSQIKIVLSWGSSPPDLDSHLTGPLPDGDRFHMYYPYADANGGSPWPDIVRLDLDDVDGNGPEMTTVLKKLPGTYRFSVHDFTNRESSNSYALSNSGATVKLYMGSELVGTYSVPQGIGGTLWTVFEINGNTVTPINSMSYEEEPGEITSVQMVKP